VWNIFKNKDAPQARWDQEVYTTTDSWEAELVRSALINEMIKADIRTNVIKDSSGKRIRRYSVSVPDVKIKQAELVIQRTSMVISRKDEIIAEQEKMESEDELSVIEAEQYVIPGERPTGEPVLLAEKDGVGKIFYHEEKDTYELRLEMDFYKESHFMNAEEWDEFTNFSAQRQEFFILLKEKYPRLAGLLKEHKKRPDFLKLIEYSYGKSQPPARH